MVLWEDFCQRYLIQFKIWDLNSKKFTGKWLNDFEMYLSWETKISVHIDSFWSRSTRELGNGLLELRRRCSWLLIRLNQMSRLTWTVKIKHITRSLNLLFFSGPSPRNAPKIPFRETKSTRWKKWDTFSLFQFLSGPHFSPRTTWSETIYSGEILRHRNKANIYPWFTKRSTKNNINFRGSRIFKLWHYCWPMKGPL